MSRDQKIQWKHTTNHNPQSDRIAECMVSTINRALQKMYRENMSDWDLLLDHVQYGYRKRSGTDVESPFEILHGTKPRFSEENEASTQENTKEERKF